MIRVLFVCLGNICRSPLAQGIFEKHIRDRKMAYKFIVDSAGTSGWHSGEKPHIGSITVARKAGVQIEGQRSRPVHSDDNEQYDYFIAMDEDNYHTLINEFGVPANKVFKIRQFDPLGKGSDVPDPYGMDMDRFAEVYEILDRSMGHFLEYIFSGHSDT